MNNRISVCGVNTKGNTILLAKRKSGGSQGGKWEFPGGKLENEETPQEALVREFYEELGVDIQVGKPLGETTFGHKGTRYTLLAFEVSLKTDDFALSDHDEAGWYNRDQIDVLELSDSDREIYKKFIR